MDLTKRKERIDREREAEYLLRRWLFNRERSHSHPALVSTARRKKMRKR
jgi:hypothetical protein